MAGAGDRAAAVAALPGLGHRLGLYEQEAVRTVEFGVLAFDEFSSRDRGRNVLLLLVVILVGGDPVPEDLIQVGLHFVRIGFVLVVVTGRYNGIGAGLVLVVLVVLVVRRSGVVGQILDLVPIVEVVVKFVFDQVLVHRLVTHVVTHRILGQAVRLVAAGS